MASRSELFEDFRQNARKLAQAAGDGQSWVNQVRHQAELSRAANRADAEERYSEAMAAVKTKYARMLEPILARIKEVSAIPEYASWDAAHWIGWTPPAELSGLPLPARLGTLSYPGTWNTVAFPCLPPFIGGRSLLIESPGIEMRQAVAGVQSFLLRRLLTLPAGKLKFTFLDPLGLGQNAAPFMKLADYDESLVSGKAWSEEQHIERQLTAMSEHMENVIQKYLRSHFDSIEAYNREAGEVAEPYRLAVVFDFPVNFSESAARRLISIAQNGPRCGVYTVILADTSRPLPHGFRLDDLRQVCAVLVKTDSGFAWQDSGSEAVYRGCQVTLDTPPANELFNSLIDQVGESSQLARAVKVPYAKVLERAGLLNSNSSSGLRAPLGPSGARKVQELVLGEGTTQHALIVGRTGSGKSTLLHVLITSLILAYSPQEIELYLVDFKKGVEFKIYAENHLPHARVIAIESEREFGLSVLQSLDFEMKRRGELFRAALVDNLSGYRQKTGQSMPRCLLMVDEFQEFFSQDDDITAQISQILDRLVRQGRSFGIHVMLGTQTLSGAYNLARSTIDQIGVRIALQCSEADSRLVLAEDNPAARLLSRPGEAIYNSANGLVEANNYFQVAWLTDEDRDRYLIEAVKKLQRHGPVRSPVIFEGGAPAEIQANSVVNGLINRPPAPSLEILKGVSFAIGEPVSLSDAVAASFRRQSASNLLIVGQNEESARGIFSAALTGLALRLAKVKDTRIFQIMDFSTRDVDGVPQWIDLANSLPHQAQVLQRRQLGEAITMLANEVTRRVEANQYKGPPRFLFIFGLQRARDLRADDSFGFSSIGDEPAGPNLPALFNTILRDGPEFGVHTLIWCDTVVNMNRSLDRRSLKEFGQRVVFQMSAEDSSNLIDNGSAGRLGSYRAYFYQEDVGRLEKFRPYGPPPVDWLLRVKNALKV